MEISTEYGVKGRYYALIAALAINMLVAVGSGSVGAFFVGLVVEAIIYGLLAAIYQAVENNNF